MPCHDRQLKVKQLVFNDQQIKRGVIEESPTQSLFSIPTTRTSTAPARGPTTKSFIIESPRRAADGTVLLSVSKNMTTNLDPMRYVYNALFGDMNHGQEGDGRGDKEAGAGRRLLQKGKTPAEIAVAVGVARQTVYTWKALFDEGGIDALRAVPLRVRASIQNAQLVNMVSAVDSRN